jgi:myo-inositol-1-phosphate synthase
MLERERLESKEDLEDAGRHEPARPALCRKDVHVGPSDYVPWLTDRKWCYIRWEGTTFGNVPLKCE